MQIDQEKLNDAIHDELERLFNKGHLREGEFIDINVEVIHLMTATLMLSCSLTGLPMTGISMDGVT